METHPRRRLLAVAALTPLVAVLAACGGSSSGGAPDTNPSGSTQPDTSPSDTGEPDSDAGPVPSVCPSEASNTASKAVPGNVPAPSGATAPYDYFAQGATKVWFFALKGSPDDLPRLRNSYDKQLTGKGYEIEGTDQEEGHEAESEFKGPHHGTTNFRPLCTGKVVFRLKLTS